MDLAFALLAENAAITGDRFFVYGGGSNNVEVPTLPWSVHMAVVARFEGTPEHAGESMNLEIILHTPGQPSAATFGPFAIELPSDAPPSAEVLAANLVFQIGNMPLSEEGWHEFDLRLSGESLKTLRFKVSLVEAPAAAGS